MPIFEETWQTYAIGTPLPTGPWTGGSGSIVAGGDVVPGTDRHAQVAVGGINYVDGVYHSSFTVWLQFYPAPGIPLGILSLINPITGDWIDIRLEQDGTVSAYSPVGGSILLGNSVDQWANFYSWNTIQVNVTFSIVLVGTTNYLGIDCEVALNGKAVILASVTTATTIASLSGAFGVNTFNIARSDYGDFVLDTLTALVAYPHPGSPSGKAFQGVLEASMLPSTGNARAISGVVEIEMLPSTANAVARHGVIEISMLPSTTNCRILHGVIELLLTLRSGIRPEYIHRRHFPGD